MKKTEEDKATAKVKALKEKLQKQYNLCSEEDGKSLKQQVAPFESEAESDRDYEDEESNSSDDGELNSSDDGESNSSDDGELKSSGDEELTSSDNGELNSSDEGEFTEFSDSEDTRHSKQKGTKNKRAHESLSNDACEDDGDRRRKKKNRDNDWRKLTKPGTSRECSSNKKKSPDKEEEDIDEGNSSTEEDQDECTEGKINFRDAIKSLKEIRDNLKGHLKADIVRKLQLTIKNLEILQILINNKIEQRGKLDEKPSILKRTKNLVLGFKALSKILDFLESCTMECPLHCIAALMELIQGIQDESLTK